MCRAFRYILKPDLETVFFEDMDSALNELNIKNDIFEYKIYGEPIEIPYDDIIYFESEYPKVYIHTVKPITYNSFTGNIDEIDNRFVMPDFIRIGQAPLGNAKTIKNKQVCVHILTMKKTLQYPVIITTGEKGLFKNQAR